MLDAYNVGMHIKTSGVFGYLLVRSLAWLRPLRPYSYRYAEEQQLIERWLGMVAETATRDPELAYEVAECARLIKGYGETHRRGKGKLPRHRRRADREPADRGSARAGESNPQGARSRAADPEGKALGTALGKPVV